MNRRLLWRMVSMAALGAAIAMAYLMRDRFAIAALPGWIDGAGALGGGDDLLGKGLLALALFAVVVFMPRLIRRVRGARASGQLCAAELRQRLARREDITVLDVRSAKDYAGELGHIDQSLNIPLDQLPGRLPELEQVRGRPIAVICRTDRMSIQAVELLRRAGFRKVRLVADGMLAWRQQDHA